LSLLPIQLICCHYSKDWYMLGKSKHNQFSKCPACGILKPMSKQATYMYYSYPRI